MTNRLKLLDECASIRTERASIYGSSRTNHERIAELWTAYLGDYISPMHVAMCQLLVKVSRLAEAANLMLRVKDMFVYAAI